MDDRRIPRRVMEGFWDGGWRGTRKRDGEVLGWVMVGYHDG